VVLGILFIMFDGCMIYVCVVLVDLFEWYGVLVLELLIFKLVWFVEVFVVGCLVFVIVCSFKGVVVYCEVV